MSPNTLTIPIYVSDGGQIVPNLLFHRSWDKLHSRCIEYPFAASQVGSAESLLDVGTAKSDVIWMQWLDQLPLKTTVTDYDPTDYPYKRAVFQQADVRHLPFEDASFEVILAVSVIEHIGLSDSQVLSSDKPPEDTLGDVEAVRELMRVLKPDGRLVMTFPYGLTDGLILGGSARGYTAHSLKRFESVARPLALDYYEYQRMGVHELYEEVKSNPSVFSHFKQQVLNRVFRSKKRVKQSPSLAPSTSIIGAVTWRKIPIEQAKATHKSHVDGVICGVWGKLK